MEDDDDLIDRIKRTSTHLEKVQKESTAVQKRAEKALRSSRPRIEPIKEPTAKAKNRKK